MLLQPLCALQTGIHARQQYPVSDQLIPPVAQAAHHRQVATGNFHGCPLPCHQDWVVAVDPGFDHPRIASNNWSGQPCKWADSVLQVDYGPDRNRTDAFSVPRSKALGIEPMQHNEPSHRILGRWWPGRARVFTGIEKLRESLSANDENVVGEANRFTRIRWLSLP